MVVEPEDVQCQCSGNLFYLKFKATRFLISEKKRNQDAERGEM